MRKSSLIVVVFVFASSLFVGVAMLPEAKATTHFVGGGGPGNYTLIQAAIDDALPGDTIFVHNGTYHENLIVNKTITLVGEDRNAAIVDGNGSGEVIHISADWTNVSEFSFVNSGMDDGNAGIVLQSVQQCTIQSNLILGGRDGIFLNLSDNNNLVHNDLSVHGRGIHIAYSNDNMIANNTVTGSGLGMLLRFSDNNTISDCITDLNIGNGISLFFSRRNTLSRNILLDNGRNGISLFRSGGYVLDNNASRNAWDGIYIADSRNVVISNNTMFENGIHMEGDVLEDWNSHEIDALNKVNGKPVYYWKNVTGGEIPPGAGQVILANCTDVIVRNQNISEASAGIELAFSSNSTITNVTAWMNKWWGLYLYFSPGNNITDNRIHNTTQDGVFLHSSNDSLLENNNVSGNRNGIVVYSSDNSTFTRNAVSSNAEHGLFVIQNNDSLISNNTIALNGQTGAHLNLSHGNWVYHNDFVANVVQAYDDTGTNVWDNGYPSGGNFWSDYSGTDLMNGPDQDSPGSDGIGDTTYDIPGGVASDRYPLRARPSSPLVLQANASNQEISLFWSPPSYDGGSPITNYRIYRGNASDTEAFLVEIGNVLNYTDTGLENGQTYYYRVGARNAVGEGPQSDEANATPSAQNVPPTCSIRSPIPGAWVGGDFTVWGMANDTDGTVEIVEIRIDESPW
ncbi:MAG: right-handed parallel beta-helix repeat-containing protein, partial [Thermoplasmata archaeon]|nr:right-handed parallel beta-helix repeat-containing protein [Thermoplasmata archaeon]